MNQSVLNKEPSTDLEYESRRTMGNTWVSGALSVWTRAKDRMGSVAASDALLTGRDFFYVNWQVDEPHSAELNSDWARKIRLCVGAPTYVKDKQLNDLKREVITALLDLDLVRIARQEGYVSELGRFRSDANSRKNKHTNLFTIILDDSHINETSEESITANIRAVHEAVGEKVEAVLKRLEVAEKLAKHFGDREP